MKETFWIIVDSKNKLIGVSTGQSQEKRFVFENKGEAEYYSLKWSGDAVKKAVLSWD